MQQKNLQPVAMQERIQTIDIIRGFALFGILIINFTVDSFGIPSMEGSSGEADHLAYWPLQFFMNDKAMAMFTFLFGLGFALQMKRIQARNDSFVKVYIRRLIILSLIGAAHEIFMARDILFDYALVGVLLLLLHKLHRKFLPVLAILCILIPWTRNTFFTGERNRKQFNNTPAEVSVDTAILESYVGVYEINSVPWFFITREGNKLFGKGPSGRFQWFAKSETEFFIRNTDKHQSFVKDSTGKVTGLILHMNGTDVPARKMQVDIQHAERKIAEQKHPKTYRQFVVSNARRFWVRLKYWSWPNYGWGFNISGILPLFLLGLYAGRRKIFYEISSHRLFLRKVMRWGFLLGITLTAISVGFEAWNFFNGIKRESYSYLIIGLVDLSWNFGVILLALAYVAGLTLLLENIDWRKRLSFLAPVGRMSLTNYLLQSIAFVIMVFRGRGDLPGLFWMLILALLVFAFIIFISHWWFKRFRIGPAEWLWRSLTYLKFQPMRLKDSDSPGNNERK